MEPVPRYPMFVLIPDERSFFLARKQGDLCWFESWGLKEEGPVHAWDGMGAKYILEWDKELGPVPALIDPDGRTEFRAVAKQYLNWAERHVQLPKYLCPAATLRVALRALPP